MFVGGEASRETEGEQAEMPETCPVKLCTVCRSQIRVARREAAGRLGHLCRSLPLVRRRLPSSQVGALA